MNSIKLAKFITIISFLVLLFSTYFLRSKVLELNTIRMSSQNVMAEEAEKNLNESLPERTKEYQNSLKQYEIKKKHYDEMLDLYESDYEEYVKRIKDKFVPHQCLEAQPNLFRLNSVTRCKRLQLNSEKNNLITLSPLAN